jgi:hypothetical protein
MVITFRRSCCRGMDGETSQIMSIDVAQTDLDRGTLAG